MKLFILEKKQRFWTCSVLFCKCPQTFLKICKTILQIFKTILSICKTVLQNFKAVLKFSKPQFAKFHKFCKKTQARNPGVQARNLGIQARNAEGAFLRFFKSIFGQIQEPFWWDFWGCNHTMFQPQKDWFWGFMAVQSTLGCLKLHTQQGMLERVSPLTYHFWVDWVSVIFTVTLFSAVVMIHQVSKLSG